MLLTAAFAFVAGILTILSPCILPVVPLVLGSSVAGGRVRSAGVVIGFGGSFLAATVVLAALLAQAGLTTSGLRIVAALALGAAGVSLAVPAVGRALERALGPRMPATWQAPGRGAGLLGGVILGGAVGLVWAPCVGPIMAAVIASAATRGPTADAIVTAFAYVVGASIPLLAIAALGRRAVASAGNPRRRAGLLRTFGVVMVAASLLVVTSADVPLENGIADALPAGWGTARIGAEPAPPGFALPGAAETRAGTAERPPSPVPATPPSPDGLPDLGPARDFEGITAWINSPPLTIGGLRGRVVLVEFWTFACINCIHVQPYVKAWYREFADQGLVIVGVHTPELSFERELGNVRDAVARDGLAFPVAFDPSFATWNAYGNHYWPAFYFIDRAGRVRHVHAGEGDYAGSEAVIRQLLAEPG